MLSGRLSTLVPFEQVQVGQVFHVSESFGHTEMDQFAELSGDHSAIHTDPETAKRLGFPDRIQYGFLLASLLSRIVGANFEQAICADVSMTFVKPAIAGERIDVRAEVTQVQEALRSVVLKIAMLSGHDVIARGKLITIFLSEGYDARARGY
jgi:acyl dehydratase